MFLYDVTSVYVEGQHNALAEFGSNRDGKKGKKQMIVGLLTDAPGEPVTIQ
jgi:transposase